MRSGSGTEVPPNFCTSNATTSQATGASPLIRKGFRTGVDCSFMPSSDKRQRQKANPAAAREARIAAEKRKRRMKSIRNVLIVAGLFAAVVLIFKFTDDDPKKTVTTSSST